MPPSSFFRMFRHISIHLFQGLKQHVHFLFLNLFHSLFVLLLCSVASEHPNANAHPRGAARRPQMLRWQGVWAGYRAGGAGCGRQAGLSSVPAFYIDLSMQLIGRRQNRSLRNAVSEFPQPINRLVCESVGNNGNSSRAPDTIISTIISAYVTSRAAPR